LNLTKNLLRQLKPYGFFVLTYYKATHDLTGEVASINEVSRELGISYLKVRKALSEIFLATRNFNYYSFIYDKAKSCYETESRRSKDNKRKDAQGEAIWSRIVSLVQEAYRKRIPSSFYWKTQAWLQNLLKQIPAEELPIYTEWWIKEQSHKLEFNAGIFCCNSMINQYKKVRQQSKESASRKRIKRKTEDFTQQSQQEEQRIVRNILKKRKSGKELSKEEFQILREWKSLREESTKSGYDDRSLEAWGNLILKSGKEKR